VEAARRHLQAALVVANQPAETPRLGALLTAVERVLTAVTDLARETRGVLESGLAERTFPGEARFLCCQPWERTELVGRTIEVVGARRKRIVLPMKMSVHQGHSVHRDYRGEWDYDLRWKPVGGFPALAAFGRAIRRAQTEVARGLDVPCPVLVACSTRSVRSSRWTDEFLRADLLLNVDDIVARGARLGRLVTIARIEGGMHDLALSSERPRERYFAAVRRWCRTYVGTGNAPTP
jgi:hypothetical protein